MQKFELGFAFRGTNSPEEKRVVEANSMREAMLALIAFYGGEDVVLVTQAHYFEKQEPLEPASEYDPDSCNGAIPFMLAPSAEG